jgi:OOP family OmpA-OmpF porin
VASSSPFMSKETDPVVYWGPGASIAISDRWRVRIDLRHGVMQGRDGLTSTFETQLGLATSFGLPTRRIRVAPPPAPEPTPDVDTDGDGIVDRLDKCPNAAEDFDGFEDADGCPDPDNDNDGIPDAADKCPNEPETKNGYEDADGCPDQIPDDVTRGLAIGAALKFEPNRARVTPAARKIVKPLLDALVAHGSIRITITAHPGKDADADLVKRRAEAVKWYLVDQGITEGRIWTALGDPAEKPRIDLALRPQ